MRLEELSLFKAMIEDGEAGRFDNVRAARNFSDRPGDRIRYVAGSGVLSAAVVSDADEWTSALRRNAARVQKMLDARERTIGIDSDFLAAQCEEKRERAAAEDAETAAYGDYEARIREVVWALSLIHI